MVQQTSSLMKVVIACSLHRGLTTLSQPSGRCSLIATQSLLLWFDYIQSKFQVFVWQWRVAKWIRLLFSLGAQYNMVVGCTEFLIPSFQAKEAQEVLSDPAGRWFLFKMELESTILLEKKDLGTHLQGLGCLNGPTSIADVIRQLEDAGEARQLKPVWKAAIIYII